MSFNPILRVENLHKSFKGVKAVHNVSFRMREGEIVGLIGPNGAGKTTFFNLIAGSVTPDKGHIFFNEQDVTSLKPHEICLLGMARTFQIVRPFKDLTTLDNVIIGALAKEKNPLRAKKNAMEILSLLDLKDKAQQQAEFLTLPERKRLEVARALATKPSLLLLDEVMAGLRPSEVDMMVGVLQNLNKQLGLSIVVIEHVMRAVMCLSNHIIVLNHGEKIAEGKPEIITKDPRVLECYLGEAAA
ncbi:MAG: ABC transporter ATP-binding protein [Alphaproteobacteria bacterium]|nr:ABC transporter ATP-binding protein [Alphaproteobacteria bacterium]